MRVSELLEGVEVKKVIGDAGVEVCGLYCDSRLVSTKGLFFALAGTSADGHSFAPYAEERGAACVVCEREVPVTVTQVIVDDSRKAMAKMSSNFYGNPSEKLKIVGVTGTNGKTSTTFLLKSIVEASGGSAGVLGTSGCFIGDKLLPTALTTPDPIELNKLLSLMADYGVDVVVMEVSAHALALKKLEGVKFEVGIFTNLTQDHLDFFQNMENYKKTKKSFFSPKFCKNMLINADDPCGREIASECEGTAYTYALDTPARFSAVDIDYSNGISYLADLDGEAANITSPLYGRFNVYNTLAAASACKILGISANDIVKGIRALREVEGRFNVIDSGKGFKVIIDYAHTPDGVKNVLTAARELCKRKLICVFGCGGNRDKSKRKVMGNIVSELADFAVITSDNPRYEDPMDIINEIEKGMKKGVSAYICIENRAKAIHYALYTAKEGDIVAILGKGSERYQEIAGIRYPYSDMETVNKLLDKA
jgi:UDP-N-acetylmuramoyl-L-alanyl-D-glutamate--2,6-diaminopimelate ligase